MKIALIGLFLSLPAWSGFWGPPPAGVTTITGPLTVISSLTVQGRFLVANSTFAVTNARVGVGTIAPSATLDVVGNGNFSSTVTVLGNAFSVGTSTF